jgi:hypothetical protein
MPGTKDGELESSHLYTLKILGQRYQLAGIDQLDGHNRDPSEWCSDGDIGWNYSPNTASLMIQADAVHSADLQEYQPDLRGFLTQYPIYTCGERAAGCSSASSTLRKLLLPPVGRPVRLHPFQITKRSGDITSAGHPARLHALPDGKLVFEITTPVFRSTLPWHVMRRKITLDPALGFAPVEYQFYVQCGEEVFPPKLTARYEDFADVGGIQVPRKLVFVTSSILQIHGRFGGALKVADFQTYEIEELTIKIRDLKLNQTFDVKDFAFNPPPGTVVSREEKPTQDLILKTGAVSLGLIVAYVGLVFLRRMAG